MFYRIYNKRDSTVKVSKGTYGLAVLCASLGLCLKYRQSDRSKTHFITRCEGGLSCVRADGTFGPCLNQSRGAKIWNWQSVASVCIRDVKSFFIECSITSCQNSQALVCQSELLCDDSARRFLSLTRPAVCFHRLRASAAKSKSS